MQHCGNYLWKRQASHWFGGSLEARTHLYQWQSNNSVSVCCTWQKKFCADRETSPQGCTTICKDKLAVWVILRTNLLMDVSAVSGFVLLCTKMKLSEARAQVLSSWVSIHWTDSGSHFRMSSQLFRKPFTEMFHGLFPVSGLDLHFPSHPMLQSG